ncbi:MAG TPA: hypothetical protein VID28_20075 [Methylomirabilota bacterium]|jgi:hypothetical protein
MTRTRALVTAALFSLLAACSTTSQSTLTYAKPGVDTVGRQHDENACLRAASGLDDQGFLLPFLPFEIDRSAYRQCMEARGYRLAQPVTGKAPRP